MISGVTLAAALAFGGADPCQPHGETNVLTNQCWGAGVAPGCFSCFYGPTCNEFNSSAACLVDASRNSFLLWQDYFAEATFPTAPPLPASWGMPYQSADVGGAVPPLEDVIRAVHRMQGNANPEGQGLLMCVGARGCALASLYAMNKVYGAAAAAAASAATQANAATAPPPPPQVYARAPYFALYPRWVPLASTGLPMDAQWNASADASDPSTWEILASPNNPDGAPLKPSVSNKSHVLCDLVYNWGWNHYPVVDLGCEISVFSLSKATGHCSSRVGWAFIKDPRLYAAAKEYNVYTAGGVAVEAQARTYSILKQILSDDGAFFKHGRSVLESRWDAIDKILPQCIQSGLLITYNKQHRGPLLWLTAPSDKDALALLAVAGILGENGPNFAGQSYNARVNMCISNSSWQLVVTRLTKICSTPAASVWGLASTVDAAKLMASGGGIFVA